MIYNILYLSGWITNDRHGRRTVYPPEYDGKLGAH